jgi:NitT/TauT family transport system substrate-binding protein
VNRPFRVLCVAVLLLTLTACRGTSSESASAAASGGAEQAELVIGVLPIVDVAPIYLALDRGLFEAEGLSVSVELVQGGAAAIPALVGGDLDISYGNWVSFLLANQEGIDLRAIAAGVSAAPGFTEFLALPDSGLEGDPARLAGSTIALNTLNNIGEMAVRATLDANGLEPSDVQLIEIPFPDMGAALERGEVDVIWASEPVPTVVKTDLDAVVVADSYVGEMEGFPVAGYQATAEFVGANPGTVAAFRRALSAAIDLIAADPAALLEVIPEYTNLPVEIAERLALPHYESELGPETLARVRDHLLRFAMIDAGLEVEDLVAPASDSE